MKPISNTERILDEVAQTCIDLLLQEPYYAHVLAGLSKEVDSKNIETLAIRAGEHRLSLVINPDFWKEQLTTARHRYGLLKHEVLHLIFRHPVQAPNFADPFLYNVAADLVVNQYINAEQRMEESLSLATFEHLSLPSDQTTAYYYDALLKASQEVDTPTAALIEQLRQSHNYDAHQSWWTSRSQMQQDLLETSLVSTIRLANERLGASGTNHLPESIQRAISSFKWTIKPTINWKRTLRLFSETSSRTYLKNTIHRPSKRYGTTPGIKVRNRQRLLVAIDTSGSLTAEELSLFFTEIHHLWTRAVEITIIECDTAIRQVWEYQGKRPTKLEGRGGTDFAPVLSYANEQQGFGGLIFFTDGEALRPTTLCKIPVLWVITEKGLAVDSPLYQQLPGRKVKMHEFANVSF